MNERAWLIAINVVGGLAVLGSYAHGIATHDAPGDTLWRGIPPALKPVYQLSMLAATAGYLTFTAFLCFRLPPETARIAGRFGFGVLLPLHLLILVPSALWMPLTFAQVAAPSPLRWWAVRGVLFAVGAGALGLIAALATVEPRQPGWLWAAALAGACAFAVQTALLDALVWPALFQPR